MKSVSICLLLLSLSTDAADRKSRGRGAWAWANATEAAKPVPAPTTPAANECPDALGEVNAKRAERGLPPFKHDAKLTQAAYAAASYRAKHGIHGHVGKSGVVGDLGDFRFMPDGAVATAAGCGALEDSWGWGTCCTYDNYTTAGAAWVRGADGRRYMHLFVSGGESSTTQSTPQVYQQSTSSTGTCADGSCGVQSTRRGIFRRR